MELFFAKYLNSARHILLSIKSQNLNISPQYFAKKIYVISRSSALKRYIICLHSRSLILFQTAENGRNVGPIDFLSNDV